MVLTQKLCMVKPGFNYGFNVKTSFCIKTTQCENTITVHSATPYVFHILRAIDSVDLFEYIVEFSMFFTEH